MALPSSLVPLRLSPRTALLLVVAAGVVVLTLGSYGMTLSLLVALAFALPAMARGNTLRASRTFVLAGGLPALLAAAGALVVSLFMRESEDAAWGVRVLGFGMGLPSLLSGAAFAVLISRARRIIDSAGLDATDRVLWFGTLAWCVAGDGHLVLMRLGGLRPTFSMAVLPTMTSLLLLFVAWRRWRRGGVLRALADGSAAPLWIIPSAEIALGALPRLISATDNRGLLVLREGAPFGEGAVVLAEAPLDSAELRAPLKGPLLLLLGHVVLYALCGPR